MTDPTETWRATMAAAPTSVQLRAAEARLAKATDENQLLLSILARIGDALSPTGQRPATALATLADDVEAYVEGHNALEAELAEARRQNRAMRQLLDYALVLRQHGERAPGGNETWRTFDRQAEALLRSLPVETVTVAGGVL